MLLFFFLLVLSQNILRSEGSSSLSVQIDGKENVLRMDDVRSGVNDFFNVDKERFALNSIWAVFGLKEGEEYSLKTWDIAGNCGSSNQICGKDCSGVKGVDCDSNTIETPLNCILSTTRRGFCWGFVETGNSQNYTVYNLSLIGIIAQTSFRGLVASYVSPGFTIRNQYQHESYSFNAMITDFTPRKQISLSNYLYAESEGRVISTEDFAFLNSKPKLTSRTVHIEESTCPQEGHPIFKGVKITQNLELNNAFRFYMILRKGNPEKLSSLLNYYILAPNGIMEWNKQLTFDIFDPCNQQFLTLQRDKMDNVFVKIPDTQRLMKEDIICVAINDITANVYDLVLYEFKNATSLFKSSDRFRGLLSQEYVESVRLRVTTGSSLSIKVSTSTVEVNFDTNDADSPILKLTTSMPLTCQIFVSASCQYNLTTTQEALFVQKHIERSCGFWYETGRFLCEGITGNFYPPAFYVHAPISGFTENTTMQAYLTRTISASDSPIQQSWFIRWWKVFAVLIVVFIVTVTYRHTFPKTKQIAAASSKILSQNNEEVEELTGKNSLVDGDEEKENVKAYGQVFNDESDDDGEYPIDYDKILKRKLEIQKRTKVCTDELFQIYREIKN